MTDFEWDEGFFLKKESKCLTQKTEIFNSPNSQYFLQKFQGLVLGWVGQIDAKVNDVAQPLWLSDCPMWALKQAKKAAYLVKTRKEASSSNIESSADRKGVWTDHTFPLTVC